MRIWDQLRRKWGSPQPLQPILSVDQSLRVAIQDGDYKAVKKQVAKLSKKILSPEANQAMMESIVSLIYVAMKTNQECRSKHQYYILLFIFGLGCSRFAKEVSKDSKLVAQITPDLRYPKGLKKAHPLKMVLDAIVHELKHRKDLSGFEEDALLNMILLLGGAWCDEGVYKHRIFKVIESKKVCDKYGWVSVYVRFNSVNMISFEAYREAQNKELIAVAAKLLEPYIKPTELITMITDYLKLEDPSVALSPSSTSSFS